MSKSVSGYSSIQIGLHWAVVVLIAFQYVAHSGIADAWDALRQGEELARDSASLTNLHIVAGIAVLLLAAARIVMRLTRGVPSPPADEPWLLQILSEAVHHAIYVLLILLPMSGLAAWFGGIPVAGSVHVWLKNALLAAIGLHIAGALFQHFIRRSDVLMRMLRTEPDTEPHKTSSHSDMESS